MPRKFTLRIPDKLDEQLEERRRKNRRSKGAEIIVMLERMIEWEERSEPSRKKGRSE